jgi:hypothetical protein
MQQIQVTSRFPYLGSWRSQGDILSVLPEKARELIEAGNAIAYPPEEPVETKPTKVEESQDVQGS